MKTVFLFLLSLAVASCSSFREKKVQDKADPMVTKVWPGQMQALSATVNDLLPLIATPKAFSDVENKPKIEQKIKSLKSLAHSLKAETAPPDNDPSIRLISERFEDNLDLAVESYSSGHYEFARSVIKSSLAQCVQCHTRVEYGPQLSKPEYLDSINKLSVVDKVQFLIASRYFTPAKEEINAALGAKSESLSIVTWQKLVQMGLVIHVRFENSPTAAAQFVDSLSANKITPYFIKRNLAFWKRSITEWGKSKETLDLKAADKLMAKAEEANRTSRSDGGLVDYLLAARGLHNYMILPRNNLDKANALYKLGLIYENVQEVGAWSINEDYFELCVRTVPHSETAKKCFARYEESLVSGFSGSSGIHIPADIQSKLNELRAIAL